MNPYLKHLNRIEFAVTMACTGRCKHCSEGGHTAQGECINGELAAKVVCAVCEHYSIRSLMTFGGEPLLYPDVVCTIHRAGRAMGIAKRTIITNGYFSRDEEQIRRVARALGESGVNEILLSVDAFHQESIPLDYVKQFAVCIQREGVFLQTHPAWLVSRADKNPYNLRTWEILQEFCSLGMEPSEGNIIFPSGNARTYLREYFEPQMDGADPYEEDPREIRTLCVSPDGSVLNGNVNREDILDILNSYSVC